MAEVFVNALAKSAGIVTTSTNCTVGMTTTVIAGVSTVNLGVGYLVNNQHFRGGTKVIDSSHSHVDKAPVNTVSILVNREVHGSYVHPNIIISTKSILIGGTFITLLPVMSTSRLRL